MFDFEMPDAIDNHGSFLEEPGVYHLAILEVNENPTKKDGTPLNGFRVECEVLGGTVSGQEGRTVGILFFAPNPAAKDGGDFGRKKIYLFGIAASLIEEIGKSPRVDLQQAVGRQFVAKLVCEKDQQGRESSFLSLSFADLWHCDSPDVAKVPLNQSALANRLPAERRSPQFFTQLKELGDKQRAAKRAAGGAAAGGGVAGGGAGHPAQPQQQPARPNGQPQTAGAAAGGGGFADI